VCLRSPLWPFGMMADAAKLAPAQLWPAIAERYRSSADGQFTDRDLAVPVLATRPETGGTPMMRSRTRREPPLWSSHMGHCRNNVGGHLTTARSALSWCSCLIELIRDPYERGHPSAGVGETQQPRPILSMAGLAARRLPARSCCLASVSLSAGATLSIAHPTTGAQGPKPKNLPAVDALASRRWRQSMALLVRQMMPSRVSTRKHDQLLALTASPGPARCYRRRLMTQRSGDRSTFAVELGSTAATASPTLSNHDQKPLAAGGSASSCAGAPAPRPNRSESPPYGVPVRSQGGSWT
jgi:hypothetical protein